MTVFDVWDSVEEFEAFGMTLMPTLAEVQVEMAPAEPLEIRRLIEDGDASVSRVAIGELRNTAPFERRVEKYHEAMARSSREDEPSGSATT